MTRQNAQEYYLIFALFLQFYLCESVFICGYFVPNFMARSTNVRTATPRRAFRRPGLDVVLPGGAGDIEMDPRRIASEFLDEHRAHGGAAAFAGADVLNVRDAALDHLAIFLVQGEEATFFAGNFCACQKLVRKCLVGSQRRRRSRWRARRQLRRSAWRRPPSACSQAASRRRRHPPGPSGPRRPC